MRWISRPICVLAIPAAVLFATLFGPVLFAPAEFAPATHDADFFLYYFPFAEAAFGLLKDGTLPLWNPYLYCGMPLLASIEIGVLYPPNWIHLFVPTARAFCLLYVFHLLLMGVGTWLFVRGRGRSAAGAMLSAMAFMFAAPPVLHHDFGMTSVVYSAAWCPLVLAAVDRCLRVQTLGSACSLAVVLACQFLAGFPMFTLYLAVLLPIYIQVFGVDWRNPAGRTSRQTLLLCGAAACLALGLVAPQLLATVEYLQQSFRGTLGYSQATHCCFPAPNLATMVCPTIFGDDRSCPYWGEGDLCDAIAFCGATTVLLGLFAFVQWRNREVFFWSAILCGTLAFCLGKYSPIYDLCYAYVPGVSRFRGIARLTIFALFAQSMLAGLGYDFIVTQMTAAYRRRMCWLTGLLPAGALLWSLQHLWQGTQPPLYWGEFFDWVRGPGAELFRTFSDVQKLEILDLSFATMLKAVCWSSGVLLVGIAVIGCWAKRRPSVVGFCLAMLLAVELYAVAAKHVLLMDTRPWKEIARRTQRAMDGEAGVFRMAGFASNPPFLPNRFLYSRLQSIGGHENFILHRYSCFICRWTGLVPSSHAYLVVPDLGRIYDLLNVRFYAIPQDIKCLDQDDELVAEAAFQFQGRAYSLYRNAGALPRARLVHRIHRAANVEESLRLLSRITGPALATQAVLESTEEVAVQPLSAADSPREDVTITEYTPNRVIVETDCDRSALLVLSDNYYPGWRATVDGHAAQIHPANVFMRGVLLPEGAHHVELTYDPAPFRTGCWLAAASALLIGVCSLRSIRSGQVRKPPASGSISETAGRR